MTITQIVATCFVTFAFGCAAFVIINVIKIELSARKPETWELAFFSFIACVIFGLWCIAVFGLIPNAPPPRHYLMG